MTEPIKTVEEMLASIPDEPTPPRPSRTAPMHDMLPRPEGMSRQVHRRLYRFACAYQKVEPRFARPTDRKQQRRLRKQVLRNVHDATPRGAQNSSAKTSTYSCLAPLVDRV